ncbi:hypothetical protein BC940DRAFT_143661 [Gongronella butleri]|nr:hypothetical protein BC940DRAFT_143661 [Gongronella butleri]
MSSIHSTLYLAHDSAETPYKIRLPPLVFTTTTTGMPFHDSQLGKHGDAPKETQIDNNALPISLPPPYLEPQVCMNNTLGINTRPRSHRLSLSSIVSSSTCTTSSDEDSGANSTTATTPSVADAITPSTTNLQATLPSPDDPNAREPQFIVQCWSLPPQIAPKQCTIAPAPSSPALRPSSTPEPEPKTEDTDLDTPLSPDIVSQMLTTPVSSPEPTIENFVNKKSHIKRPKNAWIHVSKYRNDN